MADVKNEEFLDDIDALEALAEAQEQEEIDITEEEPDELEALRAERDQLRDRFMRALRATGSFSVRSAIVTSVMDSMGLFG